MKLVSFYRDGLVCFGAVQGDEVAILSDLSGGAWQGIAKFLEAGSTSSAMSMVDDAPRLALNGLEFAPVIPEPGAIFCVGLNYASHIQEMGRDMPTKPAIFMRLPRSQVGHRQPIVVPRLSSNLDFEGELAVVIGRGGRYINESSALDHVAGYTCYNDASVRDFQRHTGQFTPGKNFWATGAFGPWMVTPDEVGDLESLAVTTRLNGQVMQQAPFSDFVFSVPALIAYLSSFTELRPGDVIITGTPGGVGVARNPPVFMKAGDLVEVEIEGIGVLENPVVSEANVLVPGLIGE